MHNCPKIQGSYCNIDKTYEWQYTSQIRQFGRGHTQAALQNAPLLAQYIHSIMSLCLC